MHSTRSRWEATDRRIGSEAEAHANAPVRRSALHRLAGRVSDRIERRRGGPVPFRVPAVADRPAVSIVIPTAGVSGDVDGSQRCYVETLLRSLVPTLGTEDEVLVVSGPEAPPELEALVVASAGSDPRVSQVVDDGGFSFSARVNLGVAHSTRPVVLLLNDDTEVLDRSWIHPMAVAATQPAVGAVGATLLYEDGTTQHAGLTTTEGLPTHAWAGWDPDDPVDGGVLQMDRRAWGVTGAALSVSRSNWDELGGFSLSFPVNYNDVDFCCKAAQMGLTNVVLGSVRLRHFETRSRPRELGESEVRALRSRWSHLLVPDPLVQGTSALVDLRADGADRG